MSPGTATRRSIAFAGKPLFALARSRTVHREFLVLHPRHSSLPTLRSTKQSCGLARANPRLLRFFIIAAPDLTRKLLRDGVVSACVRAFSAGPCGCLRVAFPRPGVRKARMPACICRQQPVCFVRACNSRVRPLGRLAASISDEDGYALTKRPGRQKMLVLPCKVPMSCSSLTGCPGSIAVNTVSAFSLVLPQRLLGVQPTISGLRVPYLCRLTNYVTTSRLAFGVSGSRRLLIELGNGAFERRLNVTDYVVFCDDSERRIVQEVQ